MEQNENTQTDSTPDGRSSDSIASSPRGYYNSAGFASEPEVEASSKNEPSGFGAESSDGPDPDGFGPTGAGNTHRSAYLPPTPSPTGYPVPKRLYRTDGPISGVSAGLAEYFNLDAVLIRVLIVAGSVVTFPVLPLVYIAAVFIIPQKDEVTAPPVMTGPAPAPVDTAPFNTAPFNTAPVDSLSGR